MRYDSDSRKYHSVQQDVEQLIEAATTPGVGVDIPALESRALSLATRQEEYHWSDVYARIRTVARVLRILADYTGDSSITYLLSNDPAHAYCWAARDSNGEDHLVNLLDGSVEWVEYSSWPPRSH